MKRERALFWLAILALAIGCLFALEGVAWGQSGPGGCQIPGPGGCQIPAPRSWQPAQRPLVPLAPSGEVPDAVKQCYDSLVRIRCGSWGGSGTYLGSRVVITCEHVLRNSSGAIEVRFPAGETVEAKALATDHGSDLALLELLADPPPQSKGVALADGTAVIGETVYSAGYGRAGSLMLSPGRISNLDQYTIAYDPTDRSRRLRRTTEASGLSEPGDSGGAWLTSDGRLRGVVWGGRQQDLTVSATTEIGDFIRDACNRWRRPFPQPDRPAVQNPPVQPPATQPPAQVTPPATPAPSLDEIERRLKEIQGGIESLKPEEAKQPVSAPVQPPAASGGEGGSSSVSIVQQGGLLDRAVPWLLAAIGLPPWLWIGAKAGVRVVRWFRGRTETPAIAAPVAPVPPAPAPSPAPAPTQDTVDPCRYWRDQLAACKQRVADLETQLANATATTNAERQHNTSLRDELTASRRRVLELQSRLEIQSTMQSPAPSQPEPVKQQIGLGWSERTNTENRYVPIQSTDRLGEAYKQTIAKYAQANPSIAPTLEAIDKMAVHVAAGYRASENMGLRAPAVQTTIHPSL